jgi:hypothetical protein
LEDQIGGRKDVWKQYNGAVVARGGLRATAGGGRLHHILALLTASPGLYSVMKIGKVQYATLKMVEQW